MGGVCCFCGHAQTPDTVRGALEQAVEELIVEGKADTFYVGNQGGFDRMALRVLREKKKKYPHIQYAVVLAYLPGGETSVGEDPTLYPEGLERVPRRWAIAHRNRWLVRHADCVLAYVEHDWGGAAQTLAHARRAGCEVRNLALWPSAR